MSMASEFSPSGVQYAEAVHALESGDIQAKIRAAFLKQSGRGDAAGVREKAVAFLEECVKDGDAEAMWMLGLCCEYGIGGEQNIDRALKLYYQSCSAGNAVGMILLKLTGGERGNGILRIRGSL